MEMNCANENSTKKSIATLVASVRTDWFWRPGSVCSEASHAAVLQQDSHPGDSVECISAGSS
jgi:hypothetical protein